MFLPFLWAETMVLPRREASKSEGETPSMTFESLAITAFVIFLPTQCSSTALLAASTSGSSGMVVFFGAVLWAHSESCLSGLQRLEDKKIGRNLGFNLGLTRGWAWVSWVRF